MPKSCLDQDQRMRRVERIRKELIRRNYDGAVVFSSGKHLMLRFSPSNYLTGQLTMGDALFLIPADEKEAPEILVSPAWDAQRFEHLEPYIVHGTGDLAGMAIQKLSSKPEASRWALAGAERLAIHECKRLLGAVPLQCEASLFDYTDQKVEFELSLIREAARIADAGFQALLNAVQVGVSEFELLAEMDYAMRKLGAADNFGLIATGTHIQAIRPAIDRRIELGDIIIAEITPEYGGYFAQLCRTIVVGPADEIVRSKYQLLISSMEAGIQAAKPGNTVEGMIDAIDSVFMDNGYEQYTRPPYMRTRGHGLGMGSPEPGNLSRQNRKTLSEGMTMIIHPNQFIPEIGYVMLGDTLEITKDGAHCLSGLERKLYEVQI